MDKPWTEIFRSKGSVYALEETTKDWLSRGTSGTVTVLQNPANHEDVRIKFEKNAQTIWWRLTSSRIKPKGERALVLKAWAVQLNHQEILAIRFSDQQSALQFAKKYHDIYPMAVSDNVKNIFDRRSSAFESNAKPMIAQDHVRPKRDQLPNSSALDDFENPYAQAQRNHRLSNPPPAILEEGGVNQNIHRHYSDPLPVQPQANKPRIVKAMPNMRPPCFDVANNNNKNNTDHETWKCSVCTYQNQCAVDVCLMCDAAAMPFSYEMMDEEDGMYGDPIMYAMGDCIPQDVGDFGRGSGNRKQIWFVMFAMIFMM